MPPEINTIEEARAEILRLEGELATATETNNNYATQVNTLTGELAKVRELNQEMFLQLRADTKTEDKSEDDAEPMSCEDFAKTLSI